MTLFYLACELSNVGVIPLGRTGEHNATRVIIDATEWREDHPNGALALLVRSPGGAVYPAKVEMSGYTLMWDVTRDETAIAGNGEIELILSADGYVAKSARCATQIDAALSQNADFPPASTPEWVSELLAAVPEIVSIPETVKVANAAAGNANAAATKATNTANDAAAAANNADAKAQSAQTAAEAANAAAKNWENEKAADSDKLDGKDASYYYSGALNYTYDGRDLSTIFASLGELHDAVAAGDFSKIRVGDYWPITLNGSFKDYATGETKNLANATFRMEVAPQVYLSYGEAAVPNHLLMCSRDLIPMSLMCRSEASTWYDKDATNPWTGSHLYQTLNAADGILPLVEAIFGSYMYAGPNGKGMRFRFEAKGPGATAATGLVWGDRGKLFLPTEREVWGQDVRSEHTYGAGAAVQWPMFIGTLRHIMKSLGNGASPYYWWVQSSADGSATDIGYVAYTGYPLSGAASNTWMSAPLCFLFV